MKRGARRAAGAARLREVGPIPTTEALPDEARASAFAEKLRASYWMRPLSWAQLLSLHEGVGAPLGSRPEVVELGSLIRKAASLDSRTDRFEAVAPVRLMDSDRVPRIE